jgi:hypothetical protein
MNKRADSVTFEFLDPTDVLVRLLVMSPLAADPKNLSLFPRTTHEYDDFADGERLHRIQAALPPGTAALTSILFFDEINRDNKGFATGDGAIIVGGFLTGMHASPPTRRRLLVHFPAFRFQRYLPIHT